MKTEIKLSLDHLPRIPTYLSSDFGVDFIGQILMQLDDSLDLERLRFPSELKQTIQPFTVNIRNRVVDSEVTLQMVRAMKTKKGKALQNEVEKILEPFFTITWI